MTRKIRVYAPLSRVAYNKQRRTTMYGGSNWRARSEWTAWLWFGIPFFLCLCLSPLYAWGIRTVMDKYEMPSTTRNTFSWGDELVMLIAIFLGLAAYNDINKEVRKLNKLRLVIASCGTLLDSLSFGVTFDKTPIRLKTWGGGDVVAYTMATALAETVSMIVMCPIILLWESGGYTSDAMAHATDLARNFSDVSRVGVGAYSVVPDLLVKDYGNGYRPLSITISSLIEGRLVALEAQTQKKIMSAKIYQAVTHMQNVTVEFVRMRERSTWWWISVGNTFIGVLYIILSPFLLWFGQGMYMIITYPVIFLVVGGLITYRWFIGDILQFPTDMHIKTVYNDITTLAGRADTLLQTTGDTSNKYSNLIAIYNISRADGYKTH